MGYASIQGRARTSSKKPAAKGICDRCGFVYQFTQLQWQWEYRGPTTQNIRVLVCPPCLDRVQDNLRTIVLPMDPEPIINARVQDFERAETNYRAVSKPTVIDPRTGIPIPSSTLRVTEDCQNRVTEPYGRPSGLSQNAVMPWNDSVMKAFGVPLDILSVTANGTATVSVTCRAVHNLQPNYQVSIAGLANNAADGFYSVNVTTATAFNYMTYGAIPAGALLTPTTRIVTALVGLPRGFVTIPKIYGPSLFPEVEAAICFLELEDGTGMFALENGGGFIALQQCMQPTDTFYFEFETGDGALLLQNGDDFLEQQQGP
jgi:hypothetical protein